MKLTYWIINKISITHVTFILILHNSNKSNYNIGENVINQDFHHLQNFVQLLFISDNDDVCTGVACHIFHLEELIIMMIMLMMMSCFIDCQYRFWTICSVNACGDSARNHSGNVSYEPKDQQDVKI